MIKSIFFKEWLKLRFYFICIGCILILLSIYTVYNLNFEFKMIEPETMMWYRFVSFDFKPYEPFQLFFYLVGAVLAIAQFIPEKVKNRIKIVTSLPISMFIVLLTHLSIGIFLILLLSLVFTILNINFFSSFYPRPILNAFLEDSSYYTLGSLIVYVGLSACILEKKIKILVVKFLILIFSLWIFSQENFYFFIWVLVLFFFIYMAYDSLKSIKEQRVNLLYSLFSGIIVFGFLGLSFKNIYFEKYLKEFTKYYIFYSPIKKQFTYQKNFGKHNFEYGLDNKEIFDRKTYESLLPFVYWSDLAIQKKLPIIIDDKSFDKNTIKKARLSFGYSPKDLKEQAVKLYPLINPNSKQGIIVFPENMIYLEKNKLVAYNYDIGFNEDLSKTLNTQLKKYGFHFPIKKIWGKTTNMKVYDLGYFIKDSKNRIFNLRSKDDKVSVKEISIPKKDFIYIGINENSQKKLAGFAIDKDNEVYLIKWDTLSFIPLKLKDFNYKTMKFKLISNPLYYLVRYNNTQKYYAKVYDKQLNLLDEVVFD